MRTTQQRSTVSLRQTLAKTSALLRKAALVGAAVLGAPLAVSVAVAWAALGALCTLVPSVVAPLAALIAWSLYLLGRATLELPIVVTASVGVGVIATRNQCMLLASAWTLIALFSLGRSIGSASQATSAQALLGCVLPGWLYVCKLRVWVPADEQKLREVEHKIYRRFVADKDFHLTRVAGLGTVHVPYCGEHTLKAPRTLVLMHGYLAGNAFWAANLRELAHHFDVYAVEWKGIGRSVRPRFTPASDQEADDFYVEAIEDWRKAMELDRFILCGHSMGGMFATYYSSKYARHLEHLVLVSPAGVNASPFLDHQLPLKSRIAFHLHITPMSVVRFAGPLGPRLVRWLVQQRSARTPPSNVIRTGEMNFQHFSAYCYHNWALRASGDIALHTHLHPEASARKTPLCELLVAGKSRVPVTFVYGGGADWMNHELGQAVVQKLARSQYAAFRRVALSGHQVFLDNPKEFNRELLEAIRDLDAAAVAGGSRQ